MLNQNDHTPKLENYSITEKIQTRDKSPVFIGHLVSHSNNDNNNNNKYNSNYNNSNNNNNNSNNFFVDSSAEESAVRLASESEMDDPRSFDPSLRQQRSRSHQVRHQTPR